MHAQCGNWSAGISNSHSKACSLIGSFLLGFTFCDGRERESDRNIRFRSSFIGYFFPEFHIVATGNVFLCLIMIRKSTKTLDNLINTRGDTPPCTNQIASRFDALSISYNYYLSLFKVGSMRYAGYQVAYIGWGKNVILLLTHLIILFTDF
jgi:hypothetical protein